MLHVNKCTKLPEILESMKLWCVDNLIEKRTQLNWSMNCIVDKLYNNKIENNYACNLAAAVNV